MPKAAHDTVWSTVTYTLSNNVEILALQGSANIDATGNGRANFLFGNSGNNTLNGAGGADFMAGGGGNDTYFVDNVGDCVVENADGGQRHGVVDGHHTSCRTTSRSWRCRARPTSTPPATDRDNFLFGNSGNNTLNGAGGADFMAGGGGDDTYFVDNAGDTVVERPRGGNDTVWSSVSYTLSANVEIWRCRARPRSTSPATATPTSCSATSPPTSSTAALAPTR